MGTLKKLILENCFIPKDFKEEVHLRNRNQLKFIFIVACVFGVCGLIDIALNAAFSTGSFIYYGFYILAGAVGLVLCYTKSGLYTPIIFMFVVVQIIFLEYFLSSPFYTSILYFVGFILYLVLVLNINPFNFLIGLVLYLLSTYFIGQNYYKIDFAKINRSFVITFILVIVAAGYMIFWKRKHLIKELKYKHQLEQEKEKYETLLEEILPVYVVDELRKTGHVTPASYDNTTILFTDIINFTEIASNLPPERVIAELNEIFTEFDRIVNEHDCTRVKTIGDAYMAVCGIPNQDKKHAEKIVCCAADFINYLKQRNETAQIKWRIRVGINSGKATAGIVGTGKYIYDLFGDSVNIASRMQTHSKPMKVTVTETTYNLVKDQFNFIQRDPINIKGKGPMTTYFLDV